MVWGSLGYAFVPLLAGVVSTLVVWSTLEHRNDSLGRPFLVLMTLVAAWAFADAIQFLVTGLDAKLLLSQVTFVVGTIIPVVWLVLTARYAGSEWPLDRRWVGLLLLEPALMALLTWTNDRHGYVWTDPKLQGNSPPTLHVTAGPAFDAHLVFAYLLISLGIALLLWVFVREQALYRRQAGLLTVGAVVPTATNVAFVFGLTPVSGIDFTSSTFAVTGVVAGLALFEFDLLDLRPAARRRAIEEFGTGIVVTDDQSRVVHANSTARRTFPDGITVGTDATDLLAVGSVADVDGQVTSTSVDGTRRFYDHRVTPLYDRRDDLLGHVVALRDVTELRAYEQRLEVTNRLLRHNLRNDVNKITGWIDQLEPHVDDEGRPILEKVSATAAEMQTLSEEASRIDSTLFHPDRDPVAVDLPAVVGTVLDDCRQRWPGVEFRRESTDRGRVLTPNAELLRTAVRHAVENAVEHNDASDPRVEIRTERAARDGSEEVRLEIADNGPGIPEMERETLLRGTETALTHCSGLGLWVIHWVVTAAGGDLDFRENEPRGSVVVLRLRPAD